MKKTGLIIFLSVGLVGITHVLWPQEYNAEEFIPTFIGQVFGVNAVPLLIGGIARVIRRKKEAFFPAWVVSFCIFGPGLLFQLHYERSEIDTAASISATNFESNSTIENVELSSVPENPRMFVSKEYGFGIVFPNGYPHTIEGIGMQGGGVRHQFLDETDEAPTLYSVTTIDGSQMYSGMDTVELLSATADMQLKMEESSHLARSKKFMKWGNRDVLFFDSNLIEEDYSYPKRSMLLLRKSDSVMFIISVLSHKRDQLDEKLQDFASTLVLIRK